MQIFTDDTLRFLRALKRHNDRDWFRARRDQYEAARDGTRHHLRRVHGCRLPAFAPEIVALSAGLALPRLQGHTLLRRQDTAQDAHRPDLPVARPAAARGCRILRRGRARNVRSSPAASTRRAGRLRAVATHIADHCARLRAIVERRAFKEAFGGLQGDQLSRGRSASRATIRPGTSSGSGSSSSGASTRPHFALSPRFAGEVAAPYAGRWRRSSGFLNEPLRRVTPNCDRTAERSGHRPGSARRPCLRTRFRVESPRVDARPACRRLRARRDRARVGRGGCRSPTSPTGRRFEPGSFCSPTRSSIARQTTSPTAPALIRHAAREALRPHTSEWLRLARLPPLPALPDVRRPPRPGPDGWPLFDTGHGRRAEFADARTIVTLNARAWGVTSRRCGQVISSTFGSRRARSPIT